MLIIKPIQDKEYQKEVARHCDYCYREECFAYSAKIDETLIASCQFDILGKNAVITDFAQVVGVDDDIEAMIILGRAVMNFMELSGAENCIYKPDNAKKYASMLGFKTIDGEYKINLKGLFDGKCSHCK